MPTCGRWNMPAAPTPPTGGHLICNLGSGSGSSVREVLDSVRRITGRPTPAVDAPNRPGDPAVLIASNARAAAELGWRPTRDLDRMVADAWQFFRQQHPTCRR